MGIGQSIGAMVDRVATNMASISNSYIYSGNSISLAGSGPNNNSRLNLNTEVYYKFLRDFHFTEACVNIFASTIAETLDKSSFDVIVYNNPQSYESNICNNFLRTAGIKEYIKNHLHDFIYRGQYSVGLDPANSKVFDIVNYSDADIVTKHGEIIGYRIGTKYIPKTHMVTYYYKAGPLFPLEETDSNKSSVGQSSPINGYVPPPRGMAQSAQNIRDRQGTLDDIMIVYAKFKGESIFKNQLYRMYQLYVLEYMLFYLGLRDTLRPELLGMATGGKQINIAQALQMCHNVESLLNQSTQGLANIIDPLAFINNLTFQILNYVKVVPSVEQYQSLNEIDAGKMAEKRQRIEEEIEKLRSSILNDLTIPTELYNGTSNRWSMMSSNDRFMTTCDTMLKSVTRFIRDLCMSVLQFNKQQVKATDIQFGLDFASMLSAYDVKNKLETLETKISTFQRVTDSLNQVIQSGIVDSLGFMRYFKDQISGIDERLAALIQENPQPQGGDNGGGPGGPPPDDMGGPSPDMGDGGDMPPGGEMQYMGGM